MKIFKNNNLNKVTIGFLGVGLMGEGMVCKLIDSGFKVYVKKNKNPETINRVKLRGAIELKTLKNMTKKCEILIQGAKKRQMPTVKYQKILKTISS